MAKVICAFAGLGKTFLSKKYNNLIDLDIQKYKYVYNNHLENYENLKGIDYKIKNKNWPNNYIDKLKELINQEKIIFVPADKDVRDILVKENIDFTFIMPSIESKDILIDRYKKRGNSEKFIKRATNDLEKWSKINYDYKTIILPKNEFLEDYLLKEKLI